MKISDINKKYTEKVAELLAKGYTINPTTMKGSEGEIAKIDLVKGNELLRVWINPEYTGWSSDPDVWREKKLVLRISKWNRDYNPLISESVWNSQVDTVEEYTYYVLEERNGGWYLDNLEEAISCEKKRVSRRKEYSYYWSTKAIDITSDKSKEIASRYLKNHLGYQRVSQDRIKVYKRVHRDENMSADYLISYNESKAITLK